MRFGRNVLVRFLMLDLTFIAIHTLLGIAVYLKWIAVWPDVLNIGRDWSAGEILNYIKWVMAVFACLTAFRQSGSRLVLALAILFMVALLDDSLMLHERGSALLIHMLALYDLFGDDQGMIGELMVWASLGVLTVGSLAIGWFTSSPADRRRVLPALVLFGGVMFCAIGLDAFHTLVKDYSLTAGLLGDLEDGGESICLTFLLACVWREFRVDARNGSSVLATTPGPDLHPGLQPAGHARPTRQSTAD